MADKVDDLMIKTLNKVSETGNITTGDIFVLKYCKHNVRNSLSLRLTSSS